MRGVCMEPGRDGGSVKLAARLSSTLTSASSVEPPVCPACGKSKMTNDEARMTKEIRSTKHEFGGE
jgi:hypothetical protein